MESQTIRVGSIYSTIEQQRESITKMQEAAKTRLHERIENFNSVLGSEVPEVLLDIISKVSQFHLMEANEHIDDEKKVHIQFLENLNDDVYYLVEVVKLALYINDSRLNLKQVDFKETLTSKNILL